MASCDVTETKGSTSTTLYQWMRGIVVDLTHHVEMKEQGSIVPEIVSGTLYSNRTKSQNQRDNAVHLDMLRMKKHLSLAVEYSERMTKRNQSHLKLLCDTEKLLFESEQRYQRLLHAKEMKERAARKRIERLSDLVYTRSKEALQYRIKTQKQIEILKLKLDELTQIEIDNRHEHDEVWSRVVMSKEEKILTLETQNAELQRQIDEMKLQVETARIIMNGSAFLKF